MALGKQYWSNRWEKCRTGWQLSDIHPKLVKYMDDLTQGRSGLKFFVPLCGKTKDIAYILSLGHSVFGIEYIEQAVEDLDKENSLGLIYDKENSTYQTTDGKLTIFKGDFQLCPIEKWGPFDVIWDRSSLIVIHYSLRLPYAELMKRSVISSSKPRHEFRYLLQSIEYDKNFYDGPPKCVTEEDINILFGRWAKIVLLERVPLEDDNLFRTVNGKLTDEAYESFHLMHNKIEV